MWPEFNMPIDQGLFFHEPRGRRTKRRKDSASPEHPHSTDLIEDPQSLLFNNAEFLCRKVEKTFFWNEAIFSLSRVLQTLKRREGIETFFKSPNREIRF
jgi:hypothetical protein